MHCFSCSIKEKKCLEPPCACGSLWLTLRTCETWFRKFKEGNFDLDDAAGSGKRKSFDDAELQSLLDEDDTQTQRQLAEALGVQQQAISKRLRAMGKIQKCGKWVPHELKVLLKPEETVNSVRYQQQMNDLSRAIAGNRPKYKERQKKVILLHDNAPSHKSKGARDTLERLQWEVLDHAAYSPDLAPSDYHLFASLGYALSEQCFDSYENLREWLIQWFNTKGRQFYWQGIHKLPERWKKCVESNGKYFE